MRWRLALGVLAVSLAAPLIRWAAAPAAFLAAGRLTLAAAVLLPLALFGPGPRFEAWRPRHYGLTLASGLLLGAHFLCWITSLGLTSVASSVFLVTLHPVVTSALGALFNRDRVGSRLGWGLALSALGAAALVGPDILRERAGAHPGLLRGDLLAFLGGLCASGYFLLGRAVRRDCSTRTYASASYSVAALAAWGGVLASHTHLGALPPRAWIAAVAMALGPQLLGHTTLNWALRRLAAGPVAVAITGEPVMASLIAWAWFREAPPWGLAVAAPLVALGIYLSTQAPAVPAGGRAEAATAV